MTSWLSRMWRQPSALYDIVPVLPHARSWVVIEQIAGLFARSTTTLSRSTRLVVAGCCGASIRMKPMMRESRRDVARTVHVKENLAALDIRPADEEFADLG